MISYWNDRAGISGNDRAGISATGMTELEYQLLE